VSVKPTQEQSTGKDGQSDDHVLSPMISITENQTQWVVTSTETIKLPPRVKHMVVGKLDLPKQSEAPQLVCIEPAQLPCDGILAARCVSQVLSKAQKLSSASDKATLQAGKSSKTRQTSRRMYVNVMVENFSTVTVELQKSTILGVAVETTVNQIKDCNYISSPGLSTHTEGANKGNRARPVSMLRKQGHQYRAPL
jgi:hypothetical protein